MRGFKLPHIGASARFAHRCRIQSIRRDTDRDVANPPRPNRRRLSSLPPGLKFSLPIKSPEVEPLSPPSVLANERAAKELRAKMRIVRTRSDLSLRIQRMEPAASPALTDGSPKLELEKGGRPTSGQTQEDLQSLSLFQHLAWKEL